MIVICIYCIIAPLITWINISIQAGRDNRIIAYIQQYCIESTRPECNLFANGSNYGEIFEIFGHLSYLSSGFSMVKIFKKMGIICILFTIIILTIVVVGWKLYEWSEDHCSIMVFYVVLLAHMTIYEAFKKYLLSPKYFYPKVTNVLYDLNFGYDIADDNKSVFLLPSKNLTKRVTKSVPLSSIRNGDNLEYSMSSNNNYTFFCLSRYACDQEIYNDSNDTYCFLRNCLKTNSIRIENSLPLDLNLYKVYPSLVTINNQIRYRGPTMNQSKIIYAIIFVLFIFIMFLYRE